MIWVIAGAWLTFLAVVVLALHCTDGDDDREGSTRG